MVARVLFYQGVVGRQLTASISAQFLVRTTAFKIFKILIDHDVIKSALVQFLHEAIELALEIALVAAHHPADLDDIAERPHRANIVVVGQFELNDIGVGNGGGNLTGADLGKDILGLEIFRQKRDFKIQAILHRHQGLVVARRFPHGDGFAFEVVQALGGFVFGRHDEQLADKLIGWREGKSFFALGSSRHTGCDQITLARFEKFEQRFAARRDDDFQQHADALGKLLGELVLETQLLALVNEEGGARVARQDPKDLALFDLAQIGKINFVFAGRKRLLDQECVDSGFEIWIVTPQPPSDRLFLDEFERAADVGRESLRRVKQIGISDRDLFLPSPHFLQKINCLDSLGSSLDANTLDLGIVQRFRIGTSFAHRDFSAGQVCQRLHRGIGGLHHDQLIDEANRPAESNPLAASGGNRQRADNDVAMAFVELIDEIVLLGDRDENRVHAQAMG